MDKSSLTGKNQHYPVKGNYF